MQQQLQQQPKGTNKLTVSWKTSPNQIIVLALVAGPFSLNPLGLDSNKCFSARDDPETRPSMQKSSRGVQCVHPKMTVA